MESILHIACRIFRQSGSGMRRRRFPNVFFPRTAELLARTRRIYLVVLSTESSAFNGLYPTYRTRRTRRQARHPEPEPYGYGGSAWNYTYQGTITRRQRELHKRTYLIRTRQSDFMRTPTARTDGKSGSARRAGYVSAGRNPSNTLGYNLGARLASIHIKEHLLNDIVGRVNALPRADETPHQIGFAEPRPPDANAQNAPATVAPLPASAVSSAQSASAPTSTNAESAPSSERIAAIRDRAASGNAEAQYNLGLLYDSGQGVPQDYAQEATWYRKAAEQGNANAQTALGSMYVNGQGVPQNNAQAAAWWRKAADQGNADGQFGLGLLYDHGSGVPQDFAEAYFWFDLAAAGNVAE